MKKPVPPEVKPCRKLLLAVADLHMRGFQRLRIMPYMGSMGAWRCVLAPASKMSARDGAWLDSLGDEGTLPRYTGAASSTIGIGRPRRARRLRASRGSSSTPSLTSPSRHLGRIGPTPAGSCTPSI